MIMATCALIRLDDNGLTGVVANKIVADPDADTAPGGHILRALRDIERVQTVPVWKRDDGGEILLDGDGAPIQDTNEDGSPKTEDVTVTQQERCEIGWTWDGTAYAAP